MYKFFLLFVLSSVVALSQIPKGFCKVTKVSTETISKSKITFKFVNPQGKPATSRVAFKMNNDTTITPKIDKAGIYSMTLDPGTYSFVFFVKYWYDVESKPIVLKPKRSEGA